MPHQQPLFQMQGQKMIAPETAVGTGAAEPVVDEYEAAKATPSVDESTVGEGAQNYPRPAKTIAYSGEDVGDSGTGEVLSTGEDSEVRNRDDDSLAGSSVDTEVDEETVNKPAEEVRPEAPQASRRNSRKAPDKS